MGRKKFELERCRGVEGGWRKKNVPGTEDSVEKRVGTLGEWTRLGLQEGGQGCARVRAPGPEKGRSREIIGKEEG